MENEESLPLNYEVLNQLLEEETMRVTPTDLPDNPFHYNNIGDADTLLQVCKALIDSNSLVGIYGYEEVIKGIYKITIEEENTFWVNEYWRDLLLECYYHGPISKNNKNLYSADSNGRVQLLLTRLATITYTVYSIQPMYRGLWAVIIYDITSGLLDPSSIETFHVSDETLEEIYRLKIERPKSILPENSSTILVDESTSRFSGAIWYDAIREKNITLAGVGGIGSYVGFMLSRMKPNQIIMYDPDIVETVNMSGQLYSKDDVGTSKVVALSDMMHKYSNYYQNIVFTEKFDENSSATDIMICGFDNMKARSLFFDKWKKHVLFRETPEKCLFIDGRLAAEEFQVFAIQGGDRRAMDEYSSKWLFSDAEADETVCSYKQTTFMANMIASVMVNLFVNFVANECNPIIDRDVPFMTSYSADTMFFKVDM